MYSLFFSFILLRLLLFFIYYCFFFMQKPEYERRISDWSSDVCSSDLLDASESYEENLATMRATPFSRYPVYRDGDEEVLGVLEVKSLLDRLDQREQDLFRDLRAAMFVSESTPALKLLEILRADRQSLAMVVDEYGDITGLVTVNDVVGEVIGGTQVGGGQSTALVVERADGAQRNPGSRHGAGDGGG